MQLSDERLVHGDVAWGGNWFFLVRDEQPELLPSQLGELSRFTNAIRCQLAREGIVEFCFIHPDDHHRLFKGLHRFK